MNENDLHERLIDYIEGNISSEQKAEMESLLMKSPQMQNELESIQSVFTELRNVSDDNVPTHYFTNFLPRLRERLESGKVHFPILVPEWLRLTAGPAVVAIFIFSIIAMYQSLKPEELQSPIYSMVNEMEQTEINSIVDETTDFESSSGILRSVENLVADLTSVSAVDSKLANDLLVLDVSSYQSEHELLSDIGDQEAEQALDILGQPSVQ